MNEFILNLQRVSCYLQVPPHNDVWYPSRQAGNHKERMSELESVIGARRRCVASPQTSSEMKESNSTRINGDMRASYQPQEDLKLSHLHWGRLFLKRNPLVAA